MSRSLTYAGAAREAGGSSNGVATPRLPSAPIGKKPLFSVSCASSWPRPVGKSGGCSRCAKKSGSKPSCAESIAIDVSDASDVSGAITNSSPTSLSALVKAGSTAGVSIVAWASWPSGISAPIARLAMDDRLVMDMGATSSSAGASMSRAGAISSRRSPGVCLIAPRNCAMPSTEESDVTEPCIAPNDIICISTGMAGRVHS